jgi:tyrosine-protein phosphatase YwqE
MEEADYQAYKEKGYEFQLNLMSLSGYYGRRPQAVSEALLKKGWYDYVGSDLHHLRRYAPMLESLKLKREQLDALSILLENNHSI